MSKYSGVLYETTKIMCPKAKREIDVYIRYITCDNNLFLKEFNGCDFGYNNSSVCKDCEKICIEKFMKRFENT